MSHIGTLIAIVGMPGSGKSVAAEFFRSKGIPVLRFGDQTDIGLAEHNLPRNEKNERWYRESLRKELGMAAMAIKIEPRIEKAVVESEHIVLDGLYSWEEYKYLKEKYPMLTLLCVYASPKVRHKRLTTRLVRPLTIEEAAARDVAEIENLNKGGPIAVADVLVSNQSSEEEFVAQLSKIYNEFI
ncbi:AAA family ATPase [Candidatus Woesebacteria bacterium]|jgi:dephospho-CoA kinase|nr:AAA family ATPase [Candidatus Woesebacteria bacterium]